MLTGTRTQSHRGRRPFRIESLLPHSSHAPAPKPAEASDANIRVVLLIASRLERLGWSIVLERQPDMRLLGQFARCREALALFDGAPPDIALVDEALLSEKNCEALSRYARGGRTRFLLIASHPVAETLAGSRYAFAAECLLRGLPAEELLTAIRRQSALRLASASRAIATPLEKAKRS